MIGGLVWTVYGYEYVFIGGAGIALINSLAYLSNSHRKADHRGSGLGASQVLLSCITLQENVIICRNAYIGNGAYLNIMFKPPISVNSSY